MSRRSHDLSRRELLGTAAGSIGTVALSSAIPREADATNGTGYELPAATDALAAFRIAIPQSALLDLKDRLARTRWPERETVDDWSQGPRLENTRELVEHWRTRHDWRRTEARINAFPQFRTQIDGLGIHFLHVRSRHEHALPMLLTHGWPGSIIEFLKVIEPLTNPTAFGGEAEDAFHVVIPSLPGFGFSDKPQAAGWDLVRTARAWALLMQRLNYTHWVAQGGDWGGWVTTLLGQQRPPGLAAIHLNFALVFPGVIPTSGLSPDEVRAAAAHEEFFNVGSGYARIMATRPQTIGYALADSPVGQASWIYDKFQAWTDNDGDPRAALSIDEMLHNISLYWFTNTAASSARYYRENSTRGLSGGRVDLPVGVTVFPREIFRAPRTWAQQSFPNLIHFNEVERGGHFAAFEQPGVFVREVRAAFRGIR